MELVKQRRIESGLADRFSFGMVIQTYCGENRVIAHQECPYLFCVFSYECMIKG
jgi:hypothetical protein